MKTRLRQLRDVMLQVGTLRGILNGCTCVLVRPCAWCRLGSLMYDAHRVIHNEKMREWRNKQRTRR